MYNPATGEVTGSPHLGGQDDLRAAVGAAESASAGRADVSPAKKSAVLFSFRELVNAHADELAAIITAEHGKVLSDAKGDVNRSLEVVEFACGISEELKGDYCDQVPTGSDVFSFRRPLGVVAGITPFNSSVTVPLWIFLVAIATANTFMLKLSERDPSASLLLAELWKRAGLPDGVFNVFHGDKEMVDGLVTHPDVDGIFLVGSTPIARHVHATGTQHGKRVQALGGAKDHAAAFGSAGQRCSAISVAVAVGEAAGDVVSWVRELASGITVTNGADPQADTGPVITPAAKDRITRIIGEAQEAGAAVVLDGRQPVVEDHENGFFVGPTILDNVRQEMAAYEEKVSGPMLVVIRVDSPDETIRVINTNPYGNKTTVFTSNGTVARTSQREVNVGMIGINVPLPVPVTWDPVGGRKNSLFGDPHIYGPDGVKFYTRGKVVTQRWPEPTFVSGASFAMPSTSDH